MSVAILIRETVVIKGLDSEKLESFLVKLIQAVGRDDAETEVSVLLTDDEEITELNGTYRGISKPTDVLSFSLQEEGGGVGLHPGMLGDIVVSIATAERQAKERNWSVEREIEFLTLHGFLHLLGHDHAEVDEATIMEAKSRELWAQVHVNLPLPENFLSFHT